MAQPIVTVYSTHKHSCFLYLTSILVDEIGENYSQDLQKLFTHLAQPTLSQLNEQDGLRNAEDSTGDPNRFKARLLIKDYKL